MAGEENQEGRRVTLTITSRDRRHVAALQKRLAHLTARIEQREAAKQSASFDREEAAAIRWALERIGVA